MQINTRIYLTTAIIRRTARLRAYETKLVTGFFLFVLFVCLVSFTFLNLLG